MTVAELLDRMSSAELTGWAAFTKWRADQQKKAAKGH